MFAILESLLNRWRALLVILNGLGKGYSASEAGLARENAVKLEGLVGSDCVKGAGVPVDNSGIIVIA
jgi:hypothetical protein